jgi:4,5-dihydroxyphthalate decarboxylase
MGSLTFGCLFSDRIEALLDGRVAMEGFGLDIRITEAQRLFRQVLRAAAFDVAELSVASHVAAVGRGARDYLGLPVFLSRSFRHSNLYVRTDRIARPEDLAGRRIGVIDWQQTAALWVRGLLADEHGVARDGVEWIAAGLHDSVADDRTRLDLPPTLRLHRSPDTLDGLLRSGAVDAIISPTAPRCFADPAVPVARMWPDARAAEADYWRRTGIFPVMHLLVLRRSLAEAHPALPGLLAAAMEEARGLAIRDRDTRDFPKLIVPWLPAHAADVAARLGEEPWTYGVEPNARTLDTLLRYAAADGLTPRRLDVAELFA